MYKIKKIKSDNKKLQIPFDRIQKGRILRLESSSQYLHNQRGVDIYLPPGYDQHPQTRYPVLYMHDGNNLFFPELAFGGMPWGLDQVLNRLISLRLIRPVIAVGIYNTVGRNSEYTWTAMQGRRRRSEGGQGPLYARYLSEELKPRVDQRLRTLTDPQNTAVMGSSLGGLISFYLGLHYPHVFGKIGIVSPSLWWNRGEAMRDAAHFPTGLKIWLDMGTREGIRRSGRVQTNPALAQTRHLKQVLQMRGYHEGHDLAYLEDRGASHNEWWWGQRLHLPLLFFFGGQRAWRLIFKEA